MGVLFAMPPITEGLQDPLASSDKWEIKYEYCIKEDVEGSDHDLI
jgi:hypothetical protein